MIQLRKKNRNSSQTRVCDFCDKSFKFDEFFCPKEDSDRDICFDCVRFANAELPNYKSFYDRTIAMFSAIAKRLLDEDTQKLMKAGFLNSDLSLTPKGEEHVLALLLDQNKVALVKEAEAIIEENESEKV